jgi:hypothetical protein
MNKIPLILGGQKFDIPDPKLSPKERLRRRLAFRNELSLYHRKCDKTGEKIISMYREDVPFPVYNWKEWFADGWDARDYGQDYDFSRPFFEQISELRDKVPHTSLVFSANVNCDFCNIIGNSKNCYLLSGSIECEDCYYGNPFRSKNCIDSLIVRDCELCLQCIDSQKLYDCQYCQNCNNSSNLQYCFNVSGSKDCFACVNLNQKQYCILNKQYSKEDYERIIAEVDHNTVWGKLEELKATLPRRAYTGLNNQNVEGDYITNSKNCFECYHCNECEDSSYCFQMMNCKDSVDVCNGEYGELIYEISGCYSANNCFFSNFVWDGAHDLCYCINTQSSNNSFGCVSLRRGEYCILNKQYTKDEYEKMLPKIVEHMKSTGEWGEFFPISMSPFAYNETTAAQYLPLSKEEVLERGLKWIDDTEKPFKILPQERAYYEKRSLELPKRAPAQRHLDRLAKRNPMHLWQRKCDKCQKDISSSCSPDAKERVYCEECFRAEVY